MTRGGDGPKQMLANFEGVLQTDGYSAYNALASEKIVHAACWAHCLRGFTDAVKLNPEDKTAIAIIVSIDELFAVDAQAREQGMDHQTRHSNRLPGSFVSGPEQETRTLPRTTQIRARPIQRWHSTIRAPQPSSST